MSGLILNSEGKADVQEMRRNSSLVVNGTLPYEAYKAWDPKLVEISKAKLTFAQDLAKYGLVDTRYDLGDITVNYEKISEMSAATASMGGVTKGQDDRLVFTTAGVPMPIFHKEFRLGAREIQAAAKSPNRGLSTFHIEQSGRKVLESVNSMFFDGVSDIEVDSNVIYGLTSHPNRGTVSATAAWGSGGDDPIADVESMLAAAYANYFDGPFVLYISNDNKAFCEKDYSATKGEKTFIERFLSYSAIAEVKFESGLANGEAVLVQMTSDVVELKVAQELVAFEQPQSHRLQHDFMVMAAMAFVVKSDANNNCGVVHLTGA